MTDIVERLGHVRWCEECTCLPLQWEAKAEIERLRAGRDNWKQQAGDYRRDVGIAASELHSARVEIERLRTLLRDALPFVNDAGVDEDPEACRNAIEIADAVRRALGPSSAWPLSFDIE